MSTYYQTTAKPRGRRETRASKSSTRSRPPSDSSKLAKKISQSSDEGIQAQSTNSRSNSPATFLHRHKTLDRHSLLETALPLSPSSRSLKSTDVNVAFESEVPLVIPLEKSNVSTPTTPLPTTAQLESRAFAHSSHARKSSNPTAEAANFGGRSSFVAPILKPATGFGTGQMSSTAEDDSKLFQQSTQIANLQPSAVDANEEDKPIPIATAEHVHISSSAIEVPDAIQEARAAHYDPVTSQQKGNLTSMQPPNPYPDTVPPTWDQTGSPPQSPVVYQYGGFQNPGQTLYPYDYSHGCPTQVGPVGYQQYGNPYYSAPFSPATEAARPPSVQRYTSRSSSGDDHSELLNRIQSVLPDLARLLDQSRDCQTRPATAEEDGTRQTPLYYHEQLVSLQQELDATKTEYGRVIRNIVDENCTLKNEAEDRKRRSRDLGGNVNDSEKFRDEFEVLQAQHQDLASSVDSIRLLNEQLIAEKLGVEKQIELMRKDKHIIKDSHHRAITELKQQHLRDITSRDREHQVNAAEHKAILSKVQMDLATLITRHTNTRKDLEMARSSEASYRLSAEARTKELDVVKLQHVQQSEKLEIDRHHALESLNQEHKSRRQLHESEIKKHVTALATFRSMEKEWDNKSHSLQAELQEHRVALATERESHASLKAIHDERNRRTADLAGSMMRWRQQRAKMQKENESLDRVLQAFGFESAVTESTPESDQLAAYAVPVPISDNKQIITPAEDLLAISKSTDVTPGPVEIELPTKEQASVKPRTEAILGLDEVTGSFQETRTALAADTATTPPTIGTSPFAENEGPPKASVRTRSTEDATRFSATIPQGQVQLAEEPVAFRPIRYYQVPGQYH